jgi:hypothetical protein
MGLLTQGYWHSTFWAEDYWNDDYWQNYGIVINQYDITVDNSIAELTIHSDTVSLTIDNGIPELSIR